MTSSIRIPFKSGRIIVLADLHLDHWTDVDRHPFVDLGLHVSLDWDIDALIIAGDITDRWRRNITAALETLARFVPRHKLFVLPGNHDFYGHALDAEHELRDMVESSGVTFLQKTELRHGSSRILACTLWTDFALTGDREKAMASAGRFMLDYHRITWRGYQASVDPDLGPKPWPRKISPEDTRILHCNQREWLESALATPHFAEKSGRTIVISHHGPHRSAAGIVTDFSPAFHSDLNDLIARYAPSIWFFGHTHRRFRATVNKTDIRNVSIGYPGEDRPSGEAALEDMCCFTSEEIG